MKKIQGKNAQSPANKGVPAKPAIKKGMGKGVKKPMRGSNKALGV